MARNFAERDATAENLDVLLDLIDSQITYRSRYLVGVALAPVRDMALLDPNNPRSVAFQVARINEHLATLPTLRQDGMLEPPQRIARSLDAEITVAEAAKLDVAEDPRLRAAASARSPTRSRRATSCSGSNAVRAEPLTGLA